MVGIVVSKSLSKKDIDQLLSVLEESEIGKLITVKISKSYMPPVWFADLAIDEQAISEFENLVRFGPLGNWEDNLLRAKHP
ncbi:hypothetical protein C0584_02780 [Candidatus Parcubacteria bacterium]|nr:MAG: hypothetical protein C0584_02780 [Candidatus Parcubacteria bacterium]